MDKKRLSIRVVSLIIFIFVLHSLASEFYWYSSIWWFDMPMHFMGGLWLGLCLIWLSFKKEFNKKLIFEIILGVLLIGIFWELFEVIVNNFTIKDSFNTLDTLSDIFFDLAGGVFAILYFFKKNILQEKNKL